MSDRDPRIDPQPGDWLRSGSRTLRVDKVDSEWVCYATFEDGNPLATSLSRTRRDRWTEACKFSGAVPADGRTWSEVPHE